MKTNPDQRSLFDKTPVIYSAEFMPADQRADLETNATKQEVKILGFFRARPNEKFNAFQVWQQTQTGEPVTSTRRAMTNLEKRGLIEKLEETSIGGYGRPNHLYRLKI